MAINEFFVTSRVDRWYVENGVDSHGPYLSQRGAVADAIQAAFPACPVIVREVLRHR